MRETNKKWVKCWSLAFFILFIAKTAAAQTGFWQQSNGPNGGRVLFLAVSSNDDIFAGTDGSVFRSADNGGIWLLINNTGMTDTEVLSLAVNSSGNIFAGTDGGIFRSADNGDTWNQTGLTRYVSAFAINDSGHIYAGSDGVYRSTDNGDTWDKINNGI